MRSGLYAQLYVGLMTAISGSGGVGFRDDVLRFGVEGFVKSLRV